MQDTNATWVDAAVGTYSGPIVIPDGDSKGISFTFVVTDTTEIEHVGLTLDISSGYYGDYLVLLQSPGGSVSQLSTPFNNGDASTDQWTFRSNHFRGESGDKGF